MEFRAGSLPFSNEITVGAACCKTSDLMKTLNETFTDDEYETMLRVKKESGLNWHDFILASCLPRNESEIKPTGKIAEYEAILFQQNGEAISHRVSSLGEVRGWAQKRVDREGGYVKIYKEPDRTFVEIIKK